MLHPFVSVPRHGHRLSLAVLVSVALHAVIIQLVLAPRPAKFISAPRPAGEHVGYIDLSYPSRPRRALVAHEPRYAELRPPPALRLAGLESIDAFVPTLVEFGSEVRYDAPAQSGHAGGLEGLAAARQQGAESPSADDEETGAFIAANVDTAAVPMPDNPKPTYPYDLLRREVEANFVAYFVVDTTGRVDAATIDVPPAVPESFTREVTQVLERWKFSPAQRRGRAVRQLMAQPFIFRITVAQD